MEVLLDFETASTCDLKKAGGFRYAEDVTTEILCLSYTYGKDVFTWYPGDGDTQCHLHELAKHPEVVFIAHNAAFEKQIWRKIMVPEYGMPDIPNERWHDTMAVCAMKVIPLNLDRAAAMLKLPIQKDMEGSRLTISLSKPNKRGYYDRSPETIKRVGAYCERDIRTEAALHRRIGTLSEAERKVWLLDQTINERGVKLDMGFVQAAQCIVRDASQPMLSEFGKLTGGLKPTQTAKFLAWCEANGAKIPNLQKETLAKLLGEDEEDQTVQWDDTVHPSIDLPSNVHRALTIRQLVGSASIKKLGRMEACVCADGRARGLIQYHGAGTGRWAGRLLQPQNFPSGTIKANERELKDDFIQRKVGAILTGDAAIVSRDVGEPVESVVSSLRHAIVAGTGRRLVAGDFSGIEARIILALAGQHDKARIMADGQDIYCVMAKSIYGRDITKETDGGIPRHIGKAAVLGCGFQMGWLKFQSQTYKKAGILLTNEQAKETVEAYRKVFAPKVPELWYALEKASTKCVWDRAPQEAYGVTYRMEDSWLTARIPSGRKLYYFNPQPIRKAMPWDDTDIRRSWSYNATKTGQIRTIDAYGGMQAENMVQALARDIMVEAMFKCEANNLPVILTVHDEIVCEPEEKYADPLALEQIMRDTPSWARALQIPIAAECWVGDRYRK